VHIRTHFTHYTVRIRTHITRYTVRIRTHFTHYTVRIRTHFGLLREAQEGIELIFTYEI